MHKDLEQITAIAMRNARKLPVVEPKIYEKIYIEAIKEVTKEEAFTDEDKILEFADRLTEQADNIVNAVNAKEYDKIEEYRNIILALKSENDELMKIAYSDELTGAYSRRWLFTKKIIENRFVDNGHMIVIDLDGFKLVNDKYGHNVGDAILKLFVEALEKKALTTDLPCEVARFGGDEFLVMIDEKSALTDIEIEQCLLSLRESLVNKLLIKSTEERISIDFSFGFSKYFTGEEFRLVMEMADQKMYSNKRQSNGSNNGMMSRLREKERQNS